MMAPQRAALQNPSEQLSELNWVPKSLCIDTHTYALCIHTFTRIPDGSYAFLNLIASQPTRGTRKLGGSLAQLWINRVLLMLFFISSPGGHEIIPPRLQLDKATRCWEGRHPVPKTCHADAPAARLSAVSLPPVLGVGLD